MEEATLREYNPTTGMYHNRIDLEKFRIATSGDRKTA